MMRFAHVLLPLSVGLAVVVGCSSIHERHYFKATSDDGATTNFYRLTVDGWTAWSSSRYISGYFDEAAVNEYFSEFKQPTTLPTVKGIATEDATGKVKPLDGATADRTLVMILSSNSDAVADGIKSISDSSEITATLARIIGREHLTESAEADIDTQLARARSAGAASVVTQAIATIEVAAAPPGANIKPVAQAELLRSMNALASFLEPGKTFVDLKEASAWIEANRNRLLEESK